MLFAFLFYTVDASAQWRISEDIDEMTGKKSSYALSERVQSTTPMNFPYQGTTGTLGVACDAGNEWAYIIFSNAPNIVNVDLEDGKNIIRPRIRWDEDVLRMQLNQVWGANSLHFWNTRRAIDYIVASNEMLIELEWYGQNRILFRFSLQGSNNAISEIRRKCANY